MKLIIISALYFIDYLILDSFHDSNERAFGHSEEATLINKTVRFLRSDGAIEFTLFWSFPLIIAACIDLIMTLPFRLKMKKSVSMATIVVFSAFILFVGFAQAQDFSTTPAPAPYYHSAYRPQTGNGGGSVQVLRYRESGTATSQAQAGRVVSASATPAAEDYTEQQLELPAGAQLLHIQLVHSARYQYEESAYRSTDAGTVTVRRGAVATPATQPAVTAQPAPSAKTATPATTVYPNPIATPGVLRLEVPAGEAVTFRLSDTQGRVVQLQQLEADVAQPGLAAQYALPLQQLPAGTYLYTLEGSTFRRVGRLVVQ